MLKKLYFIFLLLCISINAFSISNLTNKDPAGINDLREFVEQKDVEEKESSLQDVTPVKDGRNVRREYESLLGAKYSLLRHKDTFIMPVVYNWTPNDDLYRDYKEVESVNKDKTYYKNVEAEFQVSFLIPIYRKILKAEWDFIFAYTHHSWWQIYNNTWSKPFRETNYTPEFFLRNMDERSQNVLGFDIVAYDLGYEHQSNGQIQTLSRSWDRAFGRLYMNSKLFYMVLTGWVRLPSGSTDDNKDIFNYMGIGEVEIAKTFGKHTLSFKSLILSRHFSADIKYTYPWKESLLWYASFQSGYGHSLIEYNRYTQRIGVGITLESFLDNER